MSRPATSCLIAGGGVIGLCTAYYLSEAGVEVMVLDRDPSRRESCSDQNAGMVVPSHFIPLAAPGVVTQGLKWMLDRKSPFYLRPRLDPELWTWCWHFLRHANARHVANTQELLRDLSLESRAEFERLADFLKFSLVQRGLVMLCRTREGLAEESVVAEQANALGIQAEICSPERLRELDPAIQMDVAGGVWFPQDCHLDPCEFLEALRKGIRDNGGTIQTGELRDFQIRDGRAQAMTTQDHEALHADHFVIAGGVWSPALARKLGLSLPMQGGKGYSFTLTEPAELPMLCSLLKEARVAVTPMGRQLRVAGTMEICGQDLSVDPVRAQGIIESFCEFFPAFRVDHFEGLRPWSGLRPCTPDGLPYLGRVPGLENVTVATGHAMLGLSLGPITGKTIARSLMQPFREPRLSPARFTCRGATT